MKIRSPIVANAGDLDRERVVFRVPDGTELNRFILFCCNQTGSGVTSGDVPEAYWFGPTEAKKDDIVVVYTKHGTERVKTSEDGETSYFFYWGKDNSIWSNRTRAVLFHTDSWNTSEAQPHDDED